MKKKPSSTILWSAALLITFIAAVVASLFMRQGDAAGKVTRIYQNGTLLREIDLSAVEVPYEFTIETASGSNTVQVDCRRICISEADCSDQTCVKQGWLSGGATPIVCLPHQLIIRLERFDPTDALDAIAG